MGCSYKFKLQMPHGIETLSFPDRVIDGIFLFQISIPEHQLCPGDPC